MEMLGTILELGKMILAPVGEHINYHRCVDKHRENLKRKWEDLEDKKTDMQAKMNAELSPRKRPKQEFKSWLQKVERLDVEIQKFEREASKGKYLSRMHEGKLACKKIQEVQKLIDQGCGFIDTLVVDTPVSHGEELSTSTLVGEKRTMKKVWEHLIGEEFRKIGVCGMGGIGKTTVMKHINNSLLKETDKFDTIIWVTVSKAVNVIKLQNCIACKLNLNLSKYKDETTRAGKIKGELKNRKRYVLILDDMWEAFRLEDIGIPEPTPANGCKLILTTRSFEVCNRMSCEIIKMELLSKEESWDLFLDIVGRVVLNIRDLEPIMREVAEECACLPLAIVTIAGSLENVVHISVWRNTLEDLNTSMQGPGHVDNVVFEKLQLSYERLKDEKLQHCLLYCALYPEDYKIDRDELIEHLIDEKIIERMKSRQVEFDKGHTMLDKLENAGLLEGGSDNNKSFVKMHDLIRDMALRIAGPKFMVDLEDFQDEEKWGKDLVKVSLMKNSKSEFPYISPRCPKLLSLLLQDNDFCGSIPDPFFVHFCGLNVLDLSNTRIESLPGSVSDLENLSTLRLTQCQNLKHVPSLAKLTALRKLDLSGSRIEEIPHGLEMLVNLRYLGLDAPYLQKMPPGILPKLSKLQLLKFDWLSETLKVNGDEVVSLKKLECFECHFSGDNGFNTYVVSLEERRLSHYLFVVGEYKRMKSIKHWMHESKSVVLNNCNISLLMLPKDVQTLTISRCHNLRSLCDAPSLKYVRELNSIYIWYCGEIEDILSFSYTFPLQSLKVVELQYLDNLQVLFREEKVASAPAVPPGTFSCLTKFSIFKCPNIKKLFTPGLLPNLGNLEEIDVRCCEKLEEIIGGESDEDKEEEAEEEIEEAGMGSNGIFRKLRVLALSDLPELKTICSSSNVIVCDSLQLNQITHCPKLKRLPLSLCLTKRQLSSPPSLRIQINNEQWELLEWDNHDMKNVLEPLCQFYGWY